MNTTQHATMSPQVVAFLVLSARHLGLHDAVRRLQQGAGESRPARPPQRRSPRRVPAHAA